MTRYYNAGEAKRYWFGLTNPETGTTLELGPGEEVDLDMAPNTAAEDEPPNGWVDPYLKPSPSGYTPPVVEPVPDPEPVPAPTPAEEVTPAEPPQEG